MFFSKMYNYIITVPPLVHGSFEVFFGSLSCWEIQPFQLQFLHCLWYTVSRIFLYRYESVIPSTCTIFPVPLGATQRQSIIDLPSCLTVGRVISSSNASHVFSKCIFGGCGQSSIVVSSVYVNLFQKVSGLSKRCILQAMSFMLIVGMASSWQFFCVDNFCVSKIAHWTDAALLWCQVSLSAVHLYWSVGFAFIYLTSPWAVLWFYLVFQIF